MPHKKDALYTWVKRPPVCLQFYMALNRRVLQFGMTILLFLLFSKRLYFLTTVIFERLNRDLWLESGNYCKINDHTLQKKPMKAAFDPFMFVCFGLKGSCQQLWSF